MKKGFLILIAISVCALSQVGANAQSVNPLPASEVTTDRLSRVKFIYVGTPDDIRRGFDELVEKANPEWFMWQGDQGFLSKDDVKRQLELFGNKVLPHYSKL